MTIARNIRRMLSLAALAGLSTMGGCHRHPASAADCRAILDRLVEMELIEQGFHDPALVPRWQDELARRFDADLRRCGTIRVGDELDTCLRRAQNPEEIAHQCVK
ncbi:MAG TPA: hypothetical protein VH853_08320 [Polyangia bacterium]|jgi:hypothetical protein|nr:hypothetical protein [Polyangia bacterium]